MYCQLELGGRCIPVYVHCAICVSYLCNGIAEIYCQLGWGRQMYAQYMCIMLYVKLMLCNSIP